MKNRYGDKSLMHCYDLPGNTKSLQTAFNNSQGSTLMANAIKYNSSAVSLVDKLFDNCVIRDLLIPVRRPIAALFTDLFDKNNPNSVINF